MKYMELICDNCSHTHTTNVLITDNVVCPKCGLITPVDEIAMASKESCNCPVICDCETGYI